ncbi:MAG: radical SAM protein [Elusimicrobiota bacterium]
MKLCLINTPYLDVYGKIRSGKNSSFPLGLGYIASVVRQRGHEVMLVDPEAEGLSLYEAIKRIKQFNPDLAGLSSVTANFDNACLWAKEIKRNIGCPVMAGGVHVTALPEKSLQDCPEIDFLVLGEGEYVTADICDVIENKSFDPSKIPSVCFRKNGNIIKNKRSGFIENLDEIPYPARDLVDLKWYRLHPQFERGRLHATVMSSRGCPSSCTFCGNITTGRKFRPNGIKYFVDELEFLVKKYGVRHFHIVDDNFAAEKSRVTGICNEILSRNLEISWFIFGRIDQLHDEELLRLMKKSGCVFILFGIESGSQQILDNIKKGINLKQIEETCAMCRKVGIRYLNSFIIGCPGETEKTLKETINFAISLKAVISAFGVLIPFPGTPIFIKYYSDKVKGITNWQNWCSVGDNAPFEYSHTILTSKELMKFVGKAYFQYYLRIPQLIRMMGFASNPRVMFSYFKGGTGLLRASLNWIYGK